MKKYLFSVFALLALVSSNAQNANDPEAKKILDQVSAKFKTYKSVEASFVLRMENASGRALGTKTGRVYTKGNKYKITLSGQEIFCDGSNTWTYDISSNEVTVNRIDPKGNSITPQKLFTNFYDRDFKYKYNGMVTDGGRKMQEIELTPIDRSKPFSKVLLHIDNASIYSTKVFEKAGNRVTYSVSNMRAGSGLSDASFTFNAASHPGVEVVDLR